MRSPRKNRLAWAAFLGPGLLLPGTLPGQEAPTPSFPGCYDVLLGRWEGEPEFQSDSIYFAPPSRIILDSLPPPWPRHEGERSIQVAPNALPSRHEITSWTINNDTLVLGFSTGFTGFVAQIPLNRGVLRGQASTFTDVEPSPHYVADFELVKVDCETPPSPSIEDQRFLFRTLELFDGTELGLAEELVHDPSWRRKEGRVSAWIDGIGTRRFPTAQEIRISSTRQGLISLFVLRLDPDTPFDRLVSRIQEELGPPVSRNLQTVSDMEGEFVHWGNRTTTLGLNRSRYQGGEWTISVILSDPRLGR